MKFYTIAENERIPALGLGTWKSNKGDAGKAVAEALDIGYRHIDCAPIYMNEKEIGTAINAALTDGPMRRDELWITSKLWNNAHPKKYVQTALETTLRELQVDYLDLFLIHWPVHFRPGCLFPQKPEEFLAPDEVPVMETWQAMEKLVKKGMCRYIGVCNFNISRLNDLKQQAYIQPVINQIELHPYLQQQDMLDYCRENNILLTAYSPLGSTDRPAPLKKENEPSLLDHPVIVEIAEKNNLSPGQVLLAWALSRGTVVIPKSVQPEHLRENFAATDIALGGEDLRAVNGLERAYRFVDGGFFQTPGSPYTVAGIWGDK